MAEIEPLDRLVRLARGEQPPPSDESAAAMDRIRALAGPRPAPRIARWKLAAAILGAAAAVTVAAVLLLRGEKARPPAAENGNVTEYVVPTLDILGSMEKEVNQLLSSAG